MADEQTRLSHGAPDDGSLDDGSLGTNETLSEIGTAMNYGTLDSQGANSESPIPDPWPEKPAAKRSMNREHRTSSSRSRKRTRGISASSQFHVSGAGRNMNIYEAMRDDGDTEAIINEDDENSEQVSDEAIVHSLPPITKKQYILLVMLCFACFSSTVAFSCIAPFFPGEAAKKGLGQTEVGFIFSSFELVMFIMSPILGNNIGRIGSKFMFVCGLLITGVTAILFGLLMYSPPGNTFMILCFVVRIFESIGTASFMTASFAIAAHEFPGRVATTIGFLETFNGMGFAAGPPIGGALFEVGGYNLPFTVLGSLLIFVCVLAFFVMPNFHDNNEKNDAGGMLGLLAIPGILLMGLAITVCAITLTFIDPTLQPHLESFNMSPFYVGLFFLICAGTYTIFAPAWGYIVDKTTVTPLFMFGGAMLSAIALSLIGPTPIYGVQKQIWMIAFGLSLLGVAVGALFIPTFNSTLEIARSRGYPDNFTTYGYVSGIFQSCFSAGGFFGPSIGGFAMENIGFGWTATIIAAMHIVVGSLLGIYYGVFHKCQVRKSNPVSPTTDKLKGVANGAVNHAGRPDNPDIVNA